MRFSLLAIAAAAAKLCVFLSENTAVEASFLRDVVQHQPRKQRQLQRQEVLNDALLAKAVPLETYKANLRARGLSVPEELKLDSSNTPAFMRALDEGDGDDYYIDENYMYSFDGYSLKYGKCQPVQSFSEEAIEAGEYTPMVTDDIVILRLCPSQFCASSKTFGCTYNYAEYAMDLTDYVRTMIRYSQDREGQLCDYCNYCAGNANRRLNEDEENGENENQADNDEDNNEQDQNGDNNEQDQENEDADADGNENEEAQDDGDQDNNDGNAQQYSDRDCGDYLNYCQDEYGNSVCQEDQQGGGSAYMAIEGYLDYLDCVKIFDDDNYSYFVRPRCNGSTGAITVGVYYDKFCSNYAGNAVSLKDFNLGFKETAFKEFYDSSTCIDCSESSYPPYFDANSNMCNKMHSSGAKCLTNLEYDMFDEQDDTSQCSFIKSVRYGTYDEEGNLYSSQSFFGGSSSHEVTDGQKVGLVLSAVLMASLALYSCYLHHSITNLLIKSLSHTDLLPPSRYKSGANRGTSSRRVAPRSSRKSSSRRRSKYVEESDSDEWDD